MIYFDRVSKIYPKNSIALDNVSVTIAQGEFVSIVGHSGAGKTTLLKMLLGEEKPTEGAVYFESTDISKLKNSDITKFRRRIGVVFQDYRLLPNKTTYENIAFAMEAAGKTDYQIAADVPHVLDLVNLSEKMWNFPHQLSGGEKQRATIARAIINQPDIITADEPTGNLDPINTHEIVQILKKINDLGTTILLTTHNKEVVNLLKGRVVTLDKGKIIRDDKEGKYSL